MEEDTLCKLQPKERDGSHLDKIDFKPKRVTRDKDGHYILIKGIINQKDLTLINICAPNIAAAKYIKY